MPFTGERRVIWAFRSVVGPKAIGVHLFSAGIGTWRDRPEEYGPHWAGFGRRLRDRVGGSAIRVTTEGSLGAIWHEDPRYFPANDQPFMGRVKNVLQSIVIAHDRNGNVMPAYARYVAIPTGAFVPNTWVADSRATTAWGFRRIGFSFLGRLGANAFTEFWPDIRKRVFKR